MERTRRVFGATRSVYKNIGEQYIHHNSQSLRFGLKTEPQIELNRFNSVLHRDTCPKDLLPVVVTPTIKERN